MRKMAKENIIVVCTIVLCIMFTLALCVTFSGDGLLKVFAKSKVENECVYMIACGGYSDMTMARQSASLIKSKGGAGYVLKGDEIEIIYAVYKSEEDAQGVVDLLGDKGLYIKQVEIEKGDFDWCKEDMKESVVDALGYFDIAFDKMYDVANALNEDSIEIDEAKTQIDVLYAQIEDIKCKFYQDVQDCEGEQITQIKLALITALALVDGIDMELSRALCIAEVRYELVQLVLCRQALMRNI